MNIDIAQELHDLAEQEDMDADTRSMAESLSAYEQERSTARADKYTPDEVLPVDPEFAELYSAMVDFGLAHAAKSHITIVGQVRDCAGVLPVTVMRLAKIVERACVSSRTIRATRRRRCSRSCETTTPAALRCR
jgi:hypothetical protein